MKIAKVRRFGCMKAFCLFGRELFRWVDHKKVSVEVWRYCRWHKDYVQLKQHGIELPADVEPFWTGRYEISTVKLSSLSRYSCDGRLVPFCESPLALYCKTGDDRHLHDFYPAALDLGVTSSDETRYIQEEREHVDTIYRENGERGVEDFEYDMSRSCIVVDADDIVLDGHHRLSVLFAKHGPDHEVRVVRVIG